MPSVRGVHHAQITIPKGREEEARRFYCKLLGLLEIPKPEPLQNRGGFWLQAGPIEVHVGTEDGVDRQATKAHLAWQVDDVAAWETIIREAGLEIQDSVPIPGYSRFEFRDPFGNRVEMIETRD